MLETGNNLSTKNMVSIQISLNGLYFYDTKQSKLWHSSTISIDQDSQEQIKKLRKLSNAANITIATDNFIMIPSDLYLPQDTELYFKAKLLPYSIEQFSYIQTTIENATFIIAIEVDLATFFSSVFTTVIYTHPLQQTLLNSGKNGNNGIYICTSDKRCAVSIISEGKLLFSDYLKVTSELDIVYYLKKLTTDINLRNTPIYSLGINRKHIFESLLPYFSNISYKK